MIDPRRAIALAEAMRELYAEAEAAVLEAVARRLARGIDEPGWAEAKLAELSALRGQLDLIVARLEVEGPTQLTALLEQAHRDGALAAARTLGEGIALVRTSPASVGALLTATTGTLEQVRLPILRQATDVYRLVIARAAGFGVSGATTRRQAASRALADFADRGVTGFVDSAGRRWDLPSYVEMATRSAIGQSYVDGHLEELQRRDHDVVRVSDSPDECKLCRPFEGRLFSVSGGNPRYPSLSSARARGLFHPNCTHQVAPYIAGLSRPFGPTADPLGAEERARQRANEREIRRWKRRQAVALDPDAARTAANRVQAWQARQRQLMAETGRRRDYRRESLQGVR